MGSPISFSGFNDIDFNVILNAVMAQERQPITRLETQKAALATQKSAYGTLATRLGTLQSAIDSLGSASSLAVLKATSSDTGVGVATTTGSVAGSYSVVVSELARAQVLASTSTYAGVNDVVATGGGLTITPATGGPVTIGLTGSTTLAGLAAAINANTSSTVSASIVQASPGHYKLAVTSKLTGLDSAFTLSSTLTGGAGLTFADTDGDHTYGDDALDNAQTAINAALTVNGLAVTSSSNTVTDVIPGVTLTLRKKDAATTAIVDVSRDPAAAEALVGKFVTAYNAVVDFQKDQTTAAVAGKASISRDGLLRGFKNSIREVLQDQYPSGNTFTQLATVGLGFGADGKLTLDNGAFERSIASGAADVQSLFSGATGSGGAFGALRTLVDGYTQGGGFIAGESGRLDAQMSSMTRRLDTMEKRLEIRRASLQREYTAADMAMTQIKSQGSGLSQLGGQYRLF